MFPCILRVGTPFSYFISELLYVPEEALENVRTILLHVITVRLPNEEPLVNESTNTVVRPAPSQKNVVEPLPYCSVSSLHIDSCLPTNVTDANKVEEKKKEKEKEKEEEKEEEKEKEKKKEKEEEVVAVKKKEEEESKKHSNTHVEATCELSPPAKRQRLQQSMCSQLLLPLVDNVEGEGSKETLSHAANVSESCAHKEDSGALLITVLRQCSAWVLDVDLDFFSTSNPFKSLFSEVNYYTGYDTSTDSRVASTI